MQLYSINVNGNPNKAASSNGRALASHARGTGIDTPAVQFQNAQYRPNIHLSRMPWCLDKLQLRSQLADKNVFCNELHHEVAYIVDKGLKFQCLPQVPTWRCNNSAVYSWTLRSNVLQLLSVDIAQFLPDLAER
ncbi:hypothetical protein T10_5085 [Trichinella papuae]|uniref:Uncharacterized protein n=1 Tax=Trichinella papuae TaxID=268474 RepID=A0A0V1MX55_9BILA|nr:hypothetical protein T10_5085 [Trichinella papuae]